MDALNRNSEVTLGRLSEKEKKCELFSFTHHRTRSCGFRREGAAAHISTLRHELTGTGSNLRV